MNYFPFFVDVESLHGVIIGGGHIALEKITRLNMFHANLTVVATKICDEIRSIEGNIRIIEDVYKTDYLCDAQYVIAATDNTELNNQIYQDAKKRGLLINVVDVPQNCDFIFRAVLKRGKLVVGVSSSGAGPQVAIRLRNEIEKIVPKNIEDVLDYLAKERIRVKEEIKDPCERRRYLTLLADKLLKYDE